MSLVRAGFISLGTSRRCVCQRSKRWAIRGKTRNHALPGAQVVMLSAMARSGQTLEPWAPLQGDRQLNQTRRGAVQLPGRRTLASTPRFHGLNAAPNTPETLALSDRRCQTGPG
jgi:anti-sigma factor RsiW